MSALWHRGLLCGAAPPADRPTVIKWGGSLFARPSWPDDLRALLATVGSTTTLIVGGGPLVEGLRTIDRIRTGPAAAMHWLAIDAMSLTARLLAAEAGLPLTAQPADRGLVVLDVGAWLRIAGRHTDLPAGWQVSSDSIAAAVAGCHDATLLLAKSVRPPDSGSDLDSLAAAGWVDGQFPRAARALKTIAWAAPAET